jgi:hypothetical protein
MKFSRISKGKDLRDVATLPVDRFDVIRLNWDNDGYHTAAFAYDEYSMPTPAAVATKAVEELEFEDGDRFFVRWSKGGGMTEFIAEVPAAPALRARKL